MNKLDLHKLQAIQGYPAVSIFLPTHRTHPENQQDPVRLKNLVSQASDLLESTAPQQEIRDTIAELHAQAAKVDYRKCLDGLAIFVHTQYSGIFYLPFPVRERVVIEKTFATRDIQFALNRTPRYWVLVLSEKPTRLYQGTRDDLEEIVTGEFPMQHLGPGGAESLPGGYGVRKSVIRDEYDRKFFRHVDQIFSQFASSEPLPLIVVGVDRNLAFFDEVSSNEQWIVGTLTGSHDSTSPAELAKLVWPLVNDSLAQKRQEALQELDEAVSQRKFASGISSAWRAASQGRGDLLLVEQNYFFPARLDASGLVITPAEDREAPDVIWDAVDELIEMVLDKQGRVVFVDDGMLDLHMRVGLVLRY